MNDRPQIFQLERFSLVLPAQAAARPTSAHLIARTAGIRPEHVIEARRIATLSPQRPLTPLAPPPVTLGLLRGETVDYIAAKALPTKNGDTFVQYLIIPSAVLRALGGNLQPLEAFAREPFPPVHEPLQPFVIAQPRPPSPEQQSDALLALLGYCRNNIRTVSGLLASMVQGLGIVVTGAPASLRDRLTFVQGLLCLLPAPVRAAVTFATHSPEPLQLHAQIKFTPNLSALPVQHALFDWRTQTLMGNPPEDTYTKFIRAQLQLDISLVIEQTEKLARTATWRAMRRESMASALAWASKRAALDELVLQRQPADRAMVAAVLREDPTLPDELRVAYCSHLLSFSLALGDYSHTEMIPLLAAQSKEIADTVYEQLWAAASSERAMDVYRLVSQWLSEAPPGADLSRWRPLLAMAASARANELLDAPPQELATFLEQFLQATDKVPMEQVAMQLITLVRRRAAENPETARAVFLLAIYYLSLGNLQRLVAESAFQAQLPPNLRELLPHLRADAPKPAPPRLLARATEVFGEAYQPMLMGRLTDWAISVQRSDLIDTEALFGLVKLASSPFAARFDQVIQNVVDDLGTLNSLRSLRLEAHSSLITLNLVRGRYYEAVELIALCLDMIYQGTRQAQGAELLHITFRDAPIGIPELLKALDALHNSRIKPALRAKADLGALEGRRWDAALQPVTDRLSALFYNDPRLIAVIGVDAAMRLLKTAAERKDAVEALRMMNAIASYALTFGDQETHSAELVSQAYSLLAWSAEVREAGLEVVRDYIRRASVEQAAKVPQLVGFKQGESAYKALEATYRVRLVTGGADFGVFAEQAQTAALLLADIATYYENERQPPDIPKLRRNIDVMSGGLTEAERRRLSENAIAISEALLKLYQRHQKRFGKRSRQELEARQAALMRSESVPQSGVEMLQWLSARLGEGRTYPIRWQREAANYLFGTRSLNMLLRESSVVVPFLHGLLAAMPEEQTAESDLSALCSEVDALWASVAPSRQRELQPTLAPSLQQAAAAILKLGEKANERALQDANRRRQLIAGRTQPRNALEMFFWLSGYFSGEQH
ncbi:MAG: hypothetical protein D6749_05410 [Chloroflexota bacterium]|nr:MAG: hypothetical protein D6749_05410 [Chloroflexota bacterium]